jgi:hypothetical protein
MMTLRELIEAANEIAAATPDALDLPVYSEYDYGDHNHTRALTEPMQLSLSKTKDTAYSDTGLRILEEDDDDEEDEEDEEDIQKMVIVLGDVIH